MPQFYEPNFAVNNRVYEIAAEGELANVLSRYSYDFIYDAIKNNLAMVANGNMNVLNMPNLVAAIEQDFRLIKERYGSQEEVEGTRQEVYKNIIDILCGEYHLVFNDTGAFDYYSVAMALYDFLVAHFDFYVTSFFTTFIYSQAGFLYEGLGLGAAKKNKDTSTMYAKKLYDDPKLATIASNLVTILHHISGYDITLDQILHTVLTQTFADMLTMAILPQDDFYRNVYCAYVMNENNMPVTITNIRLEMQKRYRYVAPEYPMPAPNTEENPNDSEENAIQTAE